MAWAGGNDGDALILPTQAEQVLVAGDDKVSTGGQCAGDDGIVIRIVGDDATDALGPDHLCQHAVARHKISRVGLSGSEHFRPFFAREHVGQLIPLLEKLIYPLAAQGIIERTFQRWWG